MRDVDHTNLSIARSFLYECNKLPLPLIITQTYAGIRCLINYEYISMTKGVESKKLINIIAGQ